MPIYLTQIPQVRLNDEMISQKNQDFEQNSFLRAIRYDNSPKNEKHNKIVSKRMNLD